MKRRATLNAGKMGCLCAEIVERQRTSLPMGANAGETYPRSERVNGRAGISLGRLVERNKQSLSSRNRSGAEPGGAVGAQRRW